MSEPNVKPGNTTTEWKAWLVAVSAAVALGLGTILTAGLVVDETVYKVLSIIAGLLAAIGGVTLPTLGYNKGRVALKLKAEDKQQEQDNQLPPA